MKRVTSLMMAVLMSAAVMAQTAKLKKADQMFELLAFAKALELYHEVLQSDPGNAHATIQIAECYRMVNDRVNSESWFSRVVALPESRPIHTLYYAQALMQNEKYKEAKPQFEKYMDLVPEDSRGASGVKACNSISEFMATKDDYAIINQPFNTAGAEFGPAFYDKGLVYTSDRIDQGKRQAIFQWTGRPYLNLWYAENLGSNSWGTPERLTGSAETKYHDGPATFSSDQQKMFLTRNNVVGTSKVQKSEEDVVGLKIMTASKGKGAFEWTEPQDIGLNSTEFSTGHPTLSPDGNTLFFSSDRPGTRGGSDIWMSKRSADQWSEPINVGRTINTEGNELFPFMASDSTLYFTSNGHPGLGGLDIFASKMSAGGNFSTPVNMGAPINTSADDFALIRKDDLLEGYFSSNRRDGRGDDDIYSFASLKAKLEVFVYDCDTRDPIHEATVTVKLDVEAIAADKTNREGIMHASVLRNRDYSCVASKAGYDSDSTSFSTRQVRAGETVRVEICLSRSCLVEGIVKDLITQAPIMGADVTLTNLTTSQSQRVTTGTDGRYGFTAEKGTYTVAAKKEGYVYDERQITVTGASAPDQKCELRQDLMLQKFDVLVLEHIYYDFNKSTIRVDASTDLQKLLRILLDNPGTTVELGSHTDSRGEDGYNEALSQRRAQAAVNWLVANGISRDRLIAKGYGETVLRNNCGNGVPCTEYEHQRNRRTELTAVNPDGTRIAGVERFNDPAKRFEQIPGGWYGTAPRVGGTLVPGGKLPPGVEPDPPPPQPEPIP